MGFLKRSSKEGIPELPSETVISKLSSEDLYLFVETCIMTAQHQLSEYRSLAPDLKLIALEWAQSNVDAADIGLTEMRRRYSPPQT